MSPQLLRDVLSAYPSRFHAKQWAALGSGGGFSGASIYRLETDAGPFCLRCWPSDSLPAERIAGLHRLLRHVFARGVEVVAVPIDALAGETLVTRNSRLWQLEPWMPGRADFWEDSNRDRLSSAMHYLAMFHQATATYNDEGPARRWFYHQGQAASPAVAERLSLLREWRQGKLARLREQVTAVVDTGLLQIGKEFADLFEQIAGIIKEKLEILSRVRFRLQPCLRDIWHDHVLFSGNEVTGLIDASACRAESIASDLARLLGSLVADDRHAWDFAIREYEQTRPLDQQERVLIQALDESGVLLSGMIWMDRLILKRESIENSAKVWERISSLRKRLRFLADSIHGTHWDFRG